MKMCALAVLVVAGFGLSNATAAGREYTLSYSAEELNGAAGVQNVHKRILRTARLYCPTYTLIRDVREVRSCIREVMNDLVNKVDHPQLSSYHRHRGQ